MRSSPRVGLGQVHVSEQDKDVGGDRPEVDGGQRGRPGRRSVEDRRSAVLELIGGKATVDQLARRYGVKSETVEGWRQDALEGLEAALRRGTGRTGRELELEKENRELRGAVTDLSIEKAILKRELDKCRPPSVPARSRR